MGEIIPIKKFTKRKDLLSLLESQFSKGTELGVELVDVSNTNNFSCEVYIVYKKCDGEFCRDAFVITRTRRKRRIIKYCLEGDIVFY